MKIPAILVMGVATLIALPPKARCDEIHDAIADRNVQKVTELLAANPRLANAKDDSGFTPLHYAVVSDRKIVEALLARGADGNARDAKGVTPLQSVAMRDFNFFYQENAELLVRHGAEVDIFSASRMGKTARVKELLAQKPALAKERFPVDNATPLHAAARGRQKEITALLLAANANVNVADKFGWTPLHMAAKSGSKDVVELLLAAKAEIDAEDNDGKTPLQLVPYVNESRNVHAKGVSEFLLAQGAHVAKNATLVEAVEKNDFDTVKTRIKAKPDSVKHEATRTRETPLHKAAFYGGKEMLEFLIAKGADVNATDYLGQTPLSFALIKSSLANAQCLIAHGANVNTRDTRPTGETPLHFAALLKDKSLVELLIAHKAEVNARSTKGVTPLHNSARAQNKFTAEVLLQHGAEVNAKTEDGKTPLHVLAEQGDTMRGKDVAALLVAKGADVNALDANSQTPLALAAGRKFKILEDFLRQQGAK